MNYRITLLLVGIVLFFGCKELVRKTSIKTSDATEIDYNAAMLSGNIEDLSDAKHAQYGFCYATTSNPTIADSIIDLGANASRGNFSIAVRNLKPDTEYYFCAFIMEGSAVIYDVAKTFKTLVAPLPTMGISDATNVTFNSAIVISKIVSGNGDSVKTSGIYFGLVPNPTSNDDKILNKNDLRIFTDTLKNLESSTTYYCRAFGTNALGTGYSKSISFTTLPFIKPSAVTDSAYKIIDNEAVLCGNVTEKGQGEVIERGFIVSINAVPTFKDLIIKNTSAGLGVFRPKIGGLTPNTKYYYRAYAKNIGGTGLGEIKSFTTTAQTTAIQLTPTLQAVVKDTVFRFQIQIMADGGGIGEIGICWANLYPYTPSIAGPHAVADSMRISGYTTINGVRTYNVNYYCDVKDFKPSTYYAIQAYGKNGSGVSYSSKIFYTTPAPIPPTIKTFGLYKTLATSAWFVADAVSDYSDAEFGICWSLSPNPTVNDNKAIRAFTSSNQYVSLLTNLLPNTTYYARAYGKNYFGAGYGVEMQFKTLAATDVVKDFNGNEYRPVTIGSQVWLRDNLKSTHYADGTPIKDIRDLQMYKGISKNYVDVFGYLYHQGSATRYSNVESVQGACPNGYHIPTKAEFQTLVDFLGGNAIASKHLRSNDKIFWYNNDVNQLGDNTSGFYAMSSGAIVNNTSVFNGYGCYFWSSTKVDANYNFSFGLMYNSNIPEWNGPTNSNNFHSIRCIKNN